GPVEADREPVRASAQVAAQRLVDDPEQAALEIHVDPPVLADRVELDRDPGPPSALPCGPPEGRYEAEVVEDHRADVEDERLRRVEGLLDHRDEQPELGARTFGIAAQEPVEDLRLEDDVREALGGPVV